MMDGSLHQRLQQCGASQHVRAPLNTMPHVDRSTPVTLAHTLLTPCCLWHLLQWHLGSSAPWPRQTLP
jgi:hypothetical protein